MSIYRVCQYIGNKLTKAKGIAFMLTKTPEYSEPQLYSHPCHNSFGETGILLGRSI